MKLTHHVFSIYTSGEGKGKRETHRKPPPALDTSSEHRISNYHPAFSPPLDRPFRHPSHATNALETAKLAIPYSDATIDTSCVTSTTPPPASFAGYTTHAPLQINTKYYSTEIPIWVDEVPSISIAESSTKPALPAGHEDNAGSPDIWRNEFLSAEAREVRDAIGAIIVCVQRPKPPDPALREDKVVDGSENKYSTVFQNAVDRVKEITRAVGEVKALAEEERGEIGDVPGLIMLIGEDGERKPSTASEDEDSHTCAIEYGAMWWDEELSDLGTGSGIEVVCWDPKEGKEASSAKNEYGELMGMARVLEVLETHQWSSSTTDDLDDELESMNLQENEEGLPGFSLEAHELEKEMASLRLAINSNANDEDADEEFENMGDDDLEVEQLEGLMLRVQAIKDMGTDLSEQERKKFAAKAIRDLMKDI
ncbi:uncharacterized protein GIQ15_02967 [Arthroderma uncinatum]|uniref:uncharacterized protein n=1 Tax=Arthroderma uncinatum TaxID=74035 RepID=UPI00144A9687|nr:uncharacterized protein GIQ15_02967 [Arthroderma uncinatum]KAF3483643.1 hypothetical protein GIQ15_02967 [Arthroderma uncinatum]